MTVEKVWTPLSLIQWTQSYFAKNGIDSPRLEAELLLAHTMQCERIQLYTQFEREMDQEILTQYREAVKQRIDRKPLAYITGSAQFYGLDFQVDSRVLIPRTETEILVEQAIDLIRAEFPDTTAELRVADICCGSGCIGLTVAKMVPHAELTMTDLSADALVVAQLNCESLGLSERVQFFEGHLFEPLREQSLAGFQLILTNPPYVAEAVKSELEADVLDYEPHSALFAGDDGLDLVKDLINEASEFICDGGFMLMEVGYDQKVAVEELATASPLNFHAWQQDLSGHYRVAIFQKMC